VLGLLAVTAGGFALAGVNAWAWYHYRAAEDDLAHRRFTQARQHLNHCLWAWPRSAETWFLAARAARLTRDYPATDRLLQRCRQLNGVPELLDLEAALARVQRGDMAGLEAPLWVYVDKDYEDAPWILEALAQGYLHHNRWPLALTCLNRLLERQPDNTEFLTLRGGVYENAGELDAAAKDYRQAIAGDAENVPARLGQAQIDLRQSRPGEAIELYEWVRQRRPEDPEMLRGLGRAYREAGRFDEARRLLDELVTRRPRDALALAERGKLAWSEGRPGEAESWLRRSFALAPRERETNYYLFLCLQQLGKEGEAREFQERFKEIEADQARLIALYGALEKRPRDLSLPCEVAEILLRNQQDEQALAWLDGVLQQDAGYRPAHALLATLYERKGDRRRAQWHRQQSQ
jgi:Flp pilus assembly protein TadD